MQRRTFIQKSTIYGAMGIAITSGLIMPKHVLAAWPTSSFGADKFQDALNSLFGSNTLIESKDIKIKAPNIAENGAVVPITIKTSIDNTESMAIFIENNPSPLAALFNLSATTHGFVSTRVKMGKTSPVTVVVKAGDVLYSATKNVKVTIGGCGGG